MGIKMKSSGMYVVVVKDENIKMKKCPQLYQSRYEEHSLLMDPDEPQGCGLTCLLSLAKARSTSKYNKPRHWKKPYTSDDRDMYFFNALITDVWSRQQLCPLNMLFENLYTHVEIARMTANYEFKAARELLVYKLMMLGRSTSMLDFLENTHKPLDLTAPDSPNVDDPDVCKRKQPLKGCITAGSLPLGVAAAINTNSFGLFDGLKAKIVVTEDFLKRYPAERILTTLDDDNKDYIILRTWKDILGEDGVEIVSTKPAEAQHRELGPLQNYWQKLQKMCGFSTTKTEDDSMLIFDEYGAPRCQPDQWIFDWQT